MLKWRLHRRERDRPPRGTACNPTDGAVRHPGGVSGRYVPDLEHYREYAAAGEARRRDDPVPYQAYLERHVFGPDDHEAYVKEIGAMRLDGLGMPWA